MNDLLDMRVLVVETWLGLVYMGRIRRILGGLLLLLLDGVV